ncbi:MAG: hypothetical protein EPGJADBJ_04917 [Saprospiraceae bacterium]|nr:hypothetical protein [Saprospiraceae bacterium]
MFETMLITRVDHNPVTGRLYLSSYSGSALSSRMHSINLDGTSFESTAWDDLYTGIYCQRNGNIYKYYPNPAGDLFCISIPDNFQGQSCRIDIFDAAGRLIRSLDAQHTPSLIALDCSSFPAGHYVVRYRNDAGSFLLRFQKP